MECSILFNNSGGNYCIELGYVTNDGLRLDKKIGAHKKCHAVHACGYENGELKVPMHGSGPLGGSSWRLVVGEKLYVWSLQSVGYMGQMI